MLKGKRGGDRHRGYEGRGGKALRGAEKIAAFPPEQRPERIGSGAARISFCSRFARS